MTEELNTIDQFFKESLKDFEETPPFDVWEDIKNDLDARSKKKTMVMFYRIAASIAILITTSIGILIYQKGNNPVVNTAESIPESTNINILPDNVIEDNQKSEAYTNNIQTNPTDISNNNDVTHTYTNNDNSNNNILASSNNNLNSEYTDSRLEYLYGLEASITGTYNDNIHLTNQYINDRLNASLIPNVTETKDKITIDEWGIGGQFSPLLANNNNSTLLTRDNNYYIGPSHNNSTNYKNKELLSYSGGINVNIETNKRLTIQSGVYYSKHNNNDVNIENAQYLYSQPIDNVLISDKINTIYGVMGDNEVFISNDKPIFDPSSNYDGNTEQKVESNTRNYQDQQASAYTIANSYNVSLSSNTVSKSIDYIEIPFILKYKLIEDKIDLNLLGGISTGLLIGSNTFYFSEEGNRNFIPDNNKPASVNYSSIIGVGIEYPIVNKFSLTFEPSFKYYITPVGNSYSNFDSPEYSFVFFSGINYKF